MFRHIALHVSLGVALLMPAMKPVASIATGTTSSDITDVSSGTVVRSGYIVASS